MPKQSKEEEGLECYFCGVRLHVDETVCRNHKWSNHPIIYCSGTVPCRSNEADENFVNQRIEEEYQQIVQQHKDCEEFIKEKRAYHAKYGPNTPFFIFGGSDPCL